MPALAADAIDSGGGPETPSLSALIDRLLFDQQQLTAVEKFAQFHAEEAEPLQARYYSALLPASPPGPGEQYAFEVDLDACSGCKSCVTACHTLNGLDEHETWREVGLLHGGTPAGPVLQHVTSACHHCLEPACLTACPVKAYEKNPLTGIVKHLDDQCIGCQYCVFACPYDVPKYNRQKGIVRKCDMCSDRLTSGEAPACVQACPNGAIRIAVVEQRQVVADCETNQFLPGAPEPCFTLPTTNYKTRKPLARNLLPADYYTVRAEHAHWPLIVMLVLTQLSVGAFLVDWLLQTTRAGDAAAAAMPVHCLGALAVGILALAASVLHLGRPLFAFRAILGLKTSWLSREIVAFGLFSAAAAAYAGAVWLLGANPSGANTWLRACGATVVGFGLAGVFCSAMVYGATSRAFWNRYDTSIKFLLTTATLGLATVLLASMIAAGWSQSLSAGQVMVAYGHRLCQALVVAASLKLAFEALIFRHLRQKQNSPLKRTALVLSGELSPAAKSRFICGFAGGIALPALMILSVRSEGAANGAFLGATAVALFAIAVAGEILERYLFFTAVAPPRMPGGVSA
jgi:Fe-S-cluster-containing dehydrogenase component/DMSO reductase anchor subunit